MFRSCAHTHTHYCDGKNTPEDMILAAIDLGFVSLGFSGHGIASYDIVSMKPEQELAYRKEIRALQEKYADRIEILLGQEHDCLSPYAEFPYDYLIESVHHLRQPNGYWDVDWDQYHTDIAIKEGFGGDVYAYCKAYFETCADAYSHSPAQIVGHLDLVCKFNQKTPLFDENDPRYLQPAMEALECAVDRGMVVEVNTGGMAKGHRNIPYPTKPILRRLKELGGEVIVNSDCHDKTKLTYGYDLARELLLSCGFDHTLILRKHGFEEVPLR